MYTEERTHWLFSLVTKVLLSVLLMQLIVCWFLRPVSAFDFKHLIDLLQDERTATETKIQVLDEVLGLDTANFKKYVEYPTRKEPMFLTILDLSRHTNRRLASKALEIANKSYFNDIVAQQLLSDEEEISKQAHKVLASRIDSLKVLEILREAREILDNRPNNEKTKIRRKLDKLKEEIDSTGGTRVLVPTESSQGDRYYVKAEWSPRERKVVDCLTELFNRALITELTLKDEERLMKGRSNRHVYWYSKDWALWIADEIERCGGRASFVGFSFRKLK